MEVLVLEVLPKLIGFQVESIILMIGYEEEVGFIGEHPVVVYTYVGKPLLLCLADYGIDVGVLHLPCEAGEDE